MISAIDKMKLAKSANSSLAQATTLQKNAALSKIADLLIERSEEIIRANEIDLAREAADAFA